MVDIVLKVRADELLGRGHPYGTFKRRVFIAYRMNVAVSIQMRRDLGAALESMRVEVYDGRVEDFATWPTTIRKRISESRIVVADASGPSREVLFEMGFAGTKHLFPIIERVEDRDRIPSWITTINVPEYRGSGINRIASKIDLTLSQPNRGSRRPTPSPNIVSWIQQPDARWCSEARQSVENVCRETGLDFRLFDYQLYSPEELAELCRSWIVFGAIDGSEQDYLAHYVLGDIAARRRAGSGSGRRQYLQRYGVVLTESGRPREQHLATSLLRISRDILAPASQETAASLMRGHAARFKNWLRDSPPDLRGV